MTDVENEKSGANPNPEEVISKEIGETDWTEDNDQPVDDDDFDVGDLECVDDEGDDNLSDERRYIKEASPDRKKSSKRSDEYHDSHQSPKRRREYNASSMKKHSPGRAARDRRRKYEYIEKKKAERAASFKNKESGIDLEELEEVDCFEENEDTAADEALCSPSHEESPLSTPTPDHDDDPQAKRIRDGDAVSLMDEEEFPSLCEEIDPDVLKKVAHGQPMNGLVHRGQASNLEKIKDQESRQSGGNSELAEQRNGSTTLPPSNKEEARDKSRKTSPHRKLDRIDRELQRESRPSAFDRERRRSKERKDSTRDRRPGLRDRNIDGSPRHNQLTENGHATIPRFCSKQGAPSASTSKEAVVDSTRDSPRELRRSSPPLQRRLSPTRRVEDGRKRRRDDEILPPTKRQMRHLLEQLHKRNMEIKNHINRKATKNDVISS